MRKRGTAKEVSRKETKGATLDQRVSAMIISEYPLDSILTTSKEMQEARKGLVEYVQAAKPDVIFVDGLFQRMKDIETYRPEVRESNPITNFMELPFHYASELLKEIRAASPSSRIQYVFSDADEENLRALTAYRAEKIAKDNQAKVAERKKEIARLNSEIRDAKKDEGSKRKAASLEQKKTKLEAEIGKMENDPEAILKKPKAGTHGMIEFMKSTTHDFIEKIKSFGVDVSPGDVTLDIKGNSIRYAHSYVKSSNVPLKSTTGRLIGKINEMQRSGIILPDFVIESGHHAEPMIHPHRYIPAKGEIIPPHKYFLVAAGMVMEDQILLKEICDKQVTPDLFQGKQGRLEAAKRQEKKAPASGILLLWKDKDGLKKGKAYSVEHLANVGAERVKMENMVYETFNIVSDSHVGKGATHHRMLRAALNHVEKGIEERIKQGRSAPIFVNPNESLQGSNYRTFHVETSKPMTEEVLERLKAESIELRKKGISDAEIDRWYREQVREVLDCTNENRIINQLDRYHHLFTSPVVRTLANSHYDIAAIFTEATHIQHTVGEFGLTEVGLETLPIKVLDKAIRALEKDGKIAIKEKELLKGLYRKIKICESGGNGYDKFVMNFGDVSYTVAAEHKPGSAGPNSNLPMLHAKRINSMEDTAELKFAGHLHTAYFVIQGRLGKNSCDFIYKGATFSEYDDYGKAGGWPPPVIGYMKAEIPINKGGKGSAGVEFILSDYLEPKVKEMDS
ncbi:MAG: hypothetical protein QME12_02765 [Nanoarchaeota archaeon]|nr:hypothetical protein [Nanoarchaeota archaeon]